MARRWPGHRPRPPPWRRPRGGPGAPGAWAPRARGGGAPPGGGGVVAPAGRGVWGAAGRAAAGLEPVVLEAKEGLSLLNGTEGMLAPLCLALADLDRLAATA